MACVINEDQYCKPVTVLLERTRKRRIARGGMMQSTSVFLSAVALISVVPLLGSCGDDCNPKCPYYVILTVETSNGSAPQVSASVAGSPLTCSPSPTGAYCSGGGDGRLHVEAPGFQPIDIDSTVTETPAPGGCGCPGFTRVPSTVTLSPSNT
jgi:hypothetical protein